MAILPLSYHPDPVLRQKAKRVKNIDNSLQKLIDDMIETLHAVSGVGLAAPQVGVSLRLAVIELPPPDNSGPIVLVNPKIISRSGEAMVEEGCLSLPGFRGQLNRPLQITVKARDRHGKEIRIKGEGLLAEALEHELDHLNGILYIDHLKTEDKPFQIETGGES